MVIKCLECSHEYGLPLILAFHYSIYHEDKISKCSCGDKTLSGICMKTVCSFKDESGYISNSSSNSNSSSLGKVVRVNIIIWYHFLLIME